MKKTFKVLISSLLCLVLAVGHYTYTDVPKVTVDASKTEYTEIGIQPDYNIQIQYDKKKKYKTKYNVIYVFEELGLDSPVQIHSFDEYLKYLVLLDKGKYSKIYMKYDFDINEDAFEDRRSDYYNQSIPYVFSPTSNIVITIQDNVIAAKYVYDDGQNKAKKVDAEADKIISKIIKDNMSQKEKIEAIAKWLVDNVSYNFDAVKVTGDDFVDNYIDTAFAYGSIINKSAICSGYSNAFNLLARKAGIPSITVANTNNMNHAWNLYRIGDKYYEIDTTNGQTEGTEYNGKSIHDSFTEEGYYKTYLNYVSIGYLESVTEIPEKETTTVSDTENNTEEKKDENVKPVEEENKTTEDSTVDTKPVVDSEEEKVEEPVIIDIETLAGEDGYQFTDEMEISVGISKKLTYKYPFSDSDIKEIKFVNKAPSVLSVSSDGTITGLNPGKGIVKIQIYKKDGYLRQWQSHIKVH